MSVRARLFGALLLGAWGWWALGWAVDFSAVSPIHWGSLLPRFLIEAVPATVGACTAGLMVLGSPRARPLAWLFAVVAAHSAIMVVARPALTAERDETIDQSRTLWDERSHAQAGSVAGEPDADGGRSFTSDANHQPETPPRGRSRGH